jgi:hypothetical protein
MGCFSRLVTPLVTVVFVGCGSSSPGATPKGDSGSPDRSVVHDAGGHDAPADVPTTAGYPAAHPAMPQVISLGGPVMTSPKFVIITFAGDALAPQIDAFADAVAASKTYWSGTTAEYGVGPVASVVHISLAETPAATLTDSEVQAFLAGELSGPDAGTLEGGAPWPQPDGETVYMIYYPDGVSVTAASGTTCDQFYGYHEDFALSGSIYVTYSVVARCPPFPMTTAIDSITAIASHELIEATTDPLVIDKPAYVQPDDAHLAWALPSGGELGDMCATFGNVFYKPSDVPFLVQRTWSNKSAAASHDPCQPDGAVPYFNTAAVFTESVAVDSPTFGKFMTQGINIPVGSTATVTLDLYSDAKSGPWTVQGFDLASLFMTGPQELDVSFAGKSTASGSNGDVLPMSVKVLTGGSGGAEVLWIQSTIGQTETVWLGVVGSN